ncbi:GNAT family N-acetyltransferase [Bordetella genomosp. 13]|uniref:GNAT family N-acetyltransferase n=1 Tax=Bordetella genomosp. 13 TaxID=463040 RepID=UPI0011A0F42A|nr:GNAT family N-acetyltransferase [Bordetella genomosp. 13]
MDHTDLRHADTPDELRACFPVMLELRPHLRDESDFMARIARQRAEGYRLMAAWQDGRPVALSGYRVQENLVYGRFLYVDDLISSKTSRGQRWGARLLDEMEAIARREGCVRLVLDTALSNALAQRFYFRQGMLTGAMRFAKPLQDPA